MANKEIMASGAMLVLAGLGEIAATRTVCPLCVASIAGGAALIKNGLAAGANTISK